VSHGKRVPTRAVAHSVSNSEPYLEDRASDLYRRYGALPWSQLPEGTRAHFRDLVRAGVDGAGRPLA
jgi:hypothetical protein